MFIFEYLFDDVTTIRLKTWLQGETIMRSLQNYSQYICSDYEFILIEITKFLLFLQRILKPICLDKLQLISL